jgi:hypothetical protein
VQTQIIEDIIGHQKNNKQCQAFLRYKRPASSMCAALAANVISERHQFQTVVADFAVQSKSDRLRRDHFQASRDGQSLPFHDVATCKQDAPYYSPSAPNNMIPSADLQLMREYFEVRDDSIFSRADLGQVCDHKHRLVVQKTSEANASSWYFALSHFSKSSVLLWPVVKHDLPGGASYFEPNLTCSRFVLASMFDLKAWRACTLVWRSWAWQKTKLAEFSASVSPGLRAFVAHGSASLFEIACKCAFWALPKSAIVMFAKSMDIPVDSSLLLCGPLENVLNGGLRCRSVLAS